MSLVRLAVGKSSLVNAFGNAFRIVVSFFNVVIVSRWLGPDQFGYASIIISYTVFFVTLFTFGFEQSLTFFVSRLIAEQRPDLALVAFRRALLICLIVSIGLMATIAAVLPLILSHSSHAEWYWTIMIFMAQLPIAAIGFVFGSYLRGIKSFSPVIFKDQFLVPSVALAGSLIFVRWWNLGVLGFAWSQFLSYVVALIYVYILYLWYKPKGSPATVAASSGEAGIRAANEISIKNLIRFSFPLGIGNTLYLLVPHSGMMIAGLYVAAADLGRYAVSLRIAIFSQFFLMAIGPVFTPFFSELFFQRDRTELRRLHQTVHYWCSKWALCFIFAALIAGHYMLRPFGEEYAHGEWLLLVLSLGCSVEGAFGATRQSLVMAGRNLLNLGDCAFAVALNVLLVTILASRWGVDGFVVAYSATFLVLNSLRCFQFWRMTGIWPLSRSQLKTLSVATLTILGFHLLLRNASLPDLVRGALVVVILIGSIGVAFWSDRDLILGGFQPKPKVS